MKRQADALAEGTFDLLIVGGGITGAGVALDAVLRGLKVALVDKGDFASGTSSVSSKLVHGGFRYLEHGDFHLVYEALHERQRLLRNAPHLVRPLRFVIPFYERARVPTWKWCLGLTLYDLLAGAGNIRRSRPLSRVRLRRAFPGLRTTGLHGGAEYHDAQMDDARVCLAVLRTAARQGACLGNYLEAIAFEASGGTLSGARVIDHLGGREFSIRARQVLNAAGPWVDQVCRLAGDTTGPHMEPTKGVHLVTANRGLTTAFLLLHPADGRVFFVLPWLYGKMLIGTTDTQYEGMPERLDVTPEEIAYLRRGHDYYFSPPLQPGEIVGTFAGLRPLIRARPGEPSARSREFRLFTTPTGLLTVAGGKYTTYRHMAEIITDMVCRRLGRRRLCRTRDYPLAGSPAEPWAEFMQAEVSRLRGRHGLDDDAARHLVTRYGGHAADVAAYLEGDRTLASPVVPGEPDLRVEFVYQRDHEMAVRPEDFLLRRTRLGLYRPELLRQPPPEIGELSSGRR